MFVGLNAPRVLPPNRMLVAFPWLLSTASGRGGETIGHGCKQRNEKWGRARVDRVPCLVSMTATDRWQRGAAADRSLTESGRGEK